MYIEANVVLCSCIDNNEGACVLVIKNRDDFHGEPIKGDCVLQIEELMACNWENYKFRLLHGCIVAESFTDEKRFKIGTDTYKYGYNKIYIIHNSDPDLAIQKVMKFNRDKKDRVKELVKYRKSILDKLCKVYSK